MGPEARAKGDELGAIFVSQLIRWMQQGSVDLRVGGRAIFELCCFGLGGTPYSGGPAGTWPKVWQIGCTAVIKSESLFCRVDSDGWRGGRVYMRVFLISVVVGQ